MDDAHVQFDKLRNRAAGFGKVVSLGNPAPFPIVTNPMDDAWKKRFDAMYPRVDVLPANLEGRMTEGERSHIATLRLALRDGLLKFGGERVCLPVWEDDLEAIVARGQLFGPKGALIRPGEPGNCHENAARLWNSNQDRLLIATGYYLSDDGMWRSHSWCIEPRLVRPRIVETTELAVAYFGFAMMPDEAAGFVRSILRDRATDYVKR